MKHPKISIIMPCYNQAQYLDEALQSVLGQTYSNWECIIVNDGSTDNTASIVKGWLTRDKRLGYFEQENKGVSNARNTGIANSEGEFILPLDADDKISSDYLQLALDEFVKNPDLKIVYCNAKKFGKESGIWDLPPFSYANLAKENVIFSSAIFKKDDWKRIGGYDENMDKGLEDWEFWIALIKNGGEVKKIDDFCFFYRTKIESRNKNMLQNEFKELENYLSIKHAAFFVNEVGSFPFLFKKIEKITKEHHKLLNSKRFVLDLFCKTFLGFSILKNKNKR